MNTEEIMAVALDQADLAEIPADSAVYVPGTGLKRALFGIDIDIGDLLFARQAGFDVVVAHHPLGGSAASPRFTQVMWGMLDMLVAEGVAEPLARCAVAARVQQVHRRRHVANYNRVADTAAMIGLPLLNVHLPPDLVTRRFLECLVREKAGPRTAVGELVEAICALPEMLGSMVKPELWLGEPENCAGRTTVAIAGGTNGGYPVFRALYAVGVSTIITMHIDEAELACLKAEAEPHWNLIVSGHMPSDSIGLNRLIWALEDRGLECVRSSGIILAPR